MIKNVKIKNRLDLTYPDISKEWCIISNKTKTPKTVSYGSHYKANWECSVCEYKWSATIKNRTINNSGCPACTGKIVTDKNCIAITHPKLLKEWSFLKNKETTPYNVTRGSTKKAWWKCETCSHEWKTSINNRTTHKSNCPGCSRHTLSSTNCLMYKYPQSIKEWHPTLNNGKTPYDFTPDANIKVWWKCSNCNYEWNATINNKFKHNVGCKKCKTKSKGELKILNWLKVKNIQYEIQKKFDDCKSPITNWKLIYDFYIPSKNILIEFDGAQHFKIGNFNGHKMTMPELEYIKYKDKIKTDYANSKNINLLRIHYSKLDQIDDILTKHLEVK